VTANETYFEGEPKRVGVDDFNETENPKPAWFDEQRRFTDGLHRFDSYVHSDAQSEPPAGTWAPRSLIELASNPPEPPTIGGLLYPGKRTLLSGETESLKTWLALILAKAEMDAGFPVAWVDVDAMGSGELLARLRALGVPDYVVDRLFAYYEPAEQLIGDVLAEVRAHIVERGIRLFVIDAFNPMLSLHGLDPSSTPDVETFWREVATPLTTAGAAPTMLDHVVKNPDSRGKYSYGSERKASGAIVHVGFKLLEPFARSTTGRALLTTHKDRPGYLPRPAIGRLVLASDGEQVAYTLEADRSRSGDAFRPTHVIEKISTFLETQDEPVTRREIERQVDGKAEAKRIAIDVLVNEGFARQMDGPNRSKLVEHVRPYRETDDDDEPTKPGASPVRPECVPDLISKPESECVRASPPKEDAHAHADRVHPDECVPADAYYDSISDLETEELAT
jgi:hypothetical protein